MLDVHLKRSDLGNSADPADSRVLMPRQSATYFQKVCHRVEPLARYPGRWEVESTGL